MCTIRMKSAGGAGPFAPGFTYPIAWTELGGRTPPILLSAIASQRDEIVSFAPVAGPGEFLVTVMASSAMGSARISLLPAPSLSASPEAMIEAFASNFAVQSARIRAGLGELHNQLSSEALREDLAQAEQRVAQAVQNFGALPEAERVTAAKWLDANRDLWQSADSVGGGGETRPEQRWNEVRSLILAAMRDITTGVMRILSGVLAAPTFETGLGGVLSGALIGWGLATVVEGLQKHEDGLQRAWELVRLTEIDFPEEGSSLLVFGVPKPIRAVGALASLSTRHLTSPQPDVRSTALGVGEIGQEVARLPSLVLRLFRSRPSPLPTASTEQQQVLHPDLLRIESWNYPSEWRFELVPHASGAIALVGHSLRNPAGWGTARVRFRVTAGAAGTAALEVESRIRAAEFPISTYWFEGRAQSRVDYDGLVDSRTIPLPVPWQSSFSCLSQWQWGVLSVTANASYHGHWGPSWTGLHATVDFDPHHNNYVMPNHTAVASIEEGVLVVNSPFASNAEVSFGVGATFQGHPVLGSLEVAAAMLGREAIVTQPGSSSMTHAVAVTLAEGRNTFPIRLTARATQSGPWGPPNLLRRISRGEAMLIDVRVRMQ